jgi:hypothetical protein
MRSVPLLLLFAAGAAHADGGTLRLHETAGPFEVSIFTSPEPLRVGQADVSVLVQTRGADVLLEATVELRLRDPDAVEQMPVLARPSAANRLLHAATVALPRPGRWMLAVAVQRGRDRALVSSALEVAPAASPLAAHFTALALPPVCVLLFVAHQRLSRRRSRGSSER